MRSTSGTVRLGWSDAVHALHTWALVGSVLAAVGFFFGLVLYLAR